MEENGKTVTVKQLADDLGIELEDAIHLLGCYTDLLPEGVDIATYKMPVNSSFWEDVAQALAAEYKIENFPSKDFYDYRNLKDTLSVEEKIKCLRELFENSNNVHKAIYELLLSLPRHNSVQSVKTESYRQGNNPFKKAGFVYIAKQLNEQNLYKIGTTRNLDKRIKTFKTGNCFVEIIASRFCSDAYGLETFFHKFFEKKRFKGEWFFFDKDELDDILLFFNFNKHIAKENCC